MNPYDGQSTNLNVPGVSGENTAGGIGVSGSGQIGVSGNATERIGVGVQGTASHNGVGVQGTGNNGNGVYGTSKNSDAVVGVATAAGKAGILGLAPNGNAVVGISDNDTGVYAKGGKYAGAFDGNVIVTGDITLAGADCAEEFDVTATGVVDPGTVMIIDQYGALQLSQQAYDKKVVGVVSGAGDYKPGLILDKKEPSENRMPVALIGKVYCKVDAQYASIEVGDLLTTSPTPGHAMKADNPFKAFGAVIGKALRPLETGQGLIPILIALQ
jgi:hypothetical protein